jgi:RNA polymerase sigma-70 factor (ECF subfamily)
MARGRPGRHQAVVEAFFRASRGADFEALLSVLDPDVSLRPDEQARRTAVLQLHGAPAVAERLSVVRMGVAQLALIDGVPGAVWMHNGRPLVVFGFTIEGGTRPDEHRAAGVAAAPVSPRAVTFRLLGSSDQ